MHELAPWLVAKILHTIGSFSFTNNNNNDQGYWNHIKVFMSRITRISLSLRVLNKLKRGECIYLHMLHDESIIDDRIDLLLNRDPFIIHI